MKHFRAFFILAVLAVTGYLLYPTVRLVMMSAAERAADPATVDELKARSINLGLDLQGGIHMVLGIRTEKLKQNMLLALDNRVEPLFKEKGLAVLDHRSLSNGIEVDVTAAAAERRSDIEELFKILGYLDAPEFIPGTDRVTLRASINKEAFDNEAREATGRALEIIRNRIDAFGVAEPSIQQVGGDQIIVELPGAADPDRARELIGRTAQLQFHRVRDEADLSAAITALDGALGGALMKIIAPSGFLIKAENREEFVALINSPAAQNVLPRENGIFLGSLDKTKQEIPLYLLEKNPAMTGNDLVMARISQDERGRPAVSFEFGKQGADDFGELTAELMRGERRLAVVLDDVVQSAPSVRSQIRSRGEITGSFSHEEARDLAVVLRTGALPAPIEVKEERTVGPSLGADSIRKGMLAASVGFVIVIAFMVIWYKGSGIIANIALLLNIAITLAALAYLRATLTLPGIAGIVLTMGMAIDANILIYERIKEEQRAGKGVFSAINAGYDRAFITIFDANLTTLITAMALIQFGTGPIRGFAVTLTIGILASMFTAIYVTRFIFDKFILSKRDPQLSI